MKIKLSTMTNEENLSFSYPNNSTRINRRSLTVGNFNKIIFELISLIELTSLKLSLWWPLQKCINDIVFAIRFKVSCESRFIIIRVPFDLYMSLLSRSISCVANQRVVQPSSARQPHKDFEVVLFYVSYFFRGLFKERVTSR